jgi:hypothetical protein
MVTHHLISKLLIDERVSELHNAAAGPRPDRPPRSPSRRRRFALTRRRAIKPISSSPS